jgi:SNF2 family DNA or RNA helicase
LFPRGATDPKLLSLLKVPLYPYQAEGALFAARVGRALIGDDMGLGKTIQAIVAAEILARHFGVSKVLVICPTSLKYQWQSEISRFTGRGGKNAPRVIGGGRMQRQKDYALEDFCKITNYEKLKPDLDLIAAWAPELVIVDEAQRVKNWNTIAARALKRIDSSYAIVLTGTPLENKLEELISIVQFVDQHRLGPTWKLLHEHQVKDEAGRVTGYTKLEKIGQTLAPVMIRRRKSEVLQQLPVRTDQNLLVPMTEPQMIYHQENADEVAKIVRRWRKTRFLSDKDQRRLMIALQNMRMSCNSTYLLDQETDHGVKADELATLFDQLLTEPESKAVVFSQWTRTHDIVIRRLEARDRLRQLPWRRAVRQTPGAGRAVSRRPRLPRVPVHRCWQHGPQSAACLDPGEHGFAVEPRDPRTAYRAHPSHGPDAAGAGHQFRGKGHHRGGDAFDAGVQTLLVGGDPRWRQRRNFTGRFASEPLHEGRRKRHRKYR